MRSVAIAVAIGTAGWAGHTCSGLAFSAPPASNGAFTQETSTGTAASDFRHLRHSSSPWSRRPEATQHRSSRSRRYAHRPSSSTASSSRTSSFGEPCMSASSSPEEQKQQQYSKLGRSDGNGGNRGIVDSWIDTGKRFLVGVALAGTLLGGGTGLSPGGIMGPPQAAAQEMKEVGLCLLGQCQGELASCLLNPKCFANIICLNTCTGKPDEAYCQIRCGDLFENDAVGKFNACAVSKKNCVKQRQDDGSWPVPPRDAQVKSFNPKMMEGRWYISAGLNPAFDCFDCQVHFFNSPAPGKLVGKLNWRIKEPDGEFFTRDVVQKFQQDPKNPAHLINKDNEYLHYRDDWYILDAEKDSHVLVIYRGSNDAWDGYGGGTLYTKDKTVPESLVERMREKTAAAGIDWERFQYNDNSCTTQTREEASLLREKYAKKVLLSEGEQLQEQLTAVRGFAKQEVEGVEESTLEALDKLREEYQTVEQGAVENAEKLEADLARAFEAELAAFEETVAQGADTLGREAVRAENIAEDALSGGEFGTREAKSSLGRLTEKVL